LQLDDGPFIDIVILFVAAWAGGLTARALRLPMLLGYLAVGIIVGPHVLRLVGNVETVQALAEFGVILLLFAVGVEVSFRNMVQLGQVVILVGLGQVIGTAVIAFGAGLLLGWPIAQAIVLGLVISISSTMVALKTLTDRGELQTLHGRMLTGLLLLQDLAFVPMVAILPALKDQGQALPAELGLGLLKAVVVLALMVLLGGKVISWLLRRAAAIGSREAFIVTSVAIAVATAALTQSVGLSAAMGAFVAGLILSESDFGHRVLSEVVPVRDTFAALFFVSLGMLTDPGYLVDHAGLVLMVVSLVMLVKLVLTAGLLRLGGFLPNTALLTSLGLVQVGEFSFILAGSATALGIVDDGFLPLTVWAAVITMGLTPLAMAGGGRAITSLSVRIRFLRPYLPGEERSERSDERTPRMRNHVVLAGLGRIGSLVAQTLEGQAVPFIGIDLDPRTVARHRQQGQYAIHGDSGNPTVMEAARILQARLLVITTNDSMSTLLAAQHALRINPRLHIVARVQWREEGEQLMRMGVTQVVWPEMEAGLQILHQTMLSSGSPASEVESLLDSLRRDLAFGKESGNEESDARSS
jgi:CPA2 family monovalent cation:H+ antiporter-2